MKILAIGAYPGEVELGCGGCLIQSSIENKQIFIYLLSDNGWHSKNGKYSDALTALWRLVRPKSLWIDNFVEEDLLDENKVINSIKFFIQLISPDLIFSPSPHDRDPRRRSIANFVIEASGLHHNLLAYEVPGADRFCPQAYCDISAALVHKLELCSLLSGDIAHPSWVRSIAAHRASELGSDFSAAESFEVVNYHLSKDFKLETVVSRFPELPAKPSRRVGSVIEYTQRSFLPRNAGA